MKKKYLLLLSCLLPLIVHAQVNELSFNHQRIDFLAPPRTTISPMSIKMWDNYNNGGPTAYGTVMEFYGFGSHQTGQIYFGGWDNSKIRYREAFYNDNTWNDWITLLDSKNNLESSGNLMLTGNGMHFIANGNFGIGTKTPQEKLSVNGKIRAKEVKVEASGWPDYVFNPDYKLSSLAELEKYIKEKGRLPGLPNAKDVEANGIELGDMNKLLLKKIEELTLYLIEKDKQLTQANHKILEISKRIEDVQNKIN